jgi:hypothetical protein
LIYANGHRFVPRFYQLQSGADGDDSKRELQFLVDAANQAVAELGAGGDASGGTSGVGLGAATLTAIPICDVDLPHFSHISDDEENRFQMPVATYGQERDRHGGGRMLTWGGRDLSHRANVHMRLVNVGAANLVKANQLLGYPVCLVCGQSRSPYSSQREQDSFREEHRRRCGRDVANVGFYADIVADAVGLADFGNRTEAYSVLEALRQGAARVLDMQEDDLQVLVMGKTGTEDADSLLYDPMPGGSGLLDQMIERWDEVIAAALEIARDCASDCDASCPDCLQRFRNAYYHRYLNRHTATELIERWGNDLVESHEIPSRLPTPAAEGKPVNPGEQILAAMLDRAGLHGYEPQYEIDLGKPLGTTTPDFFFEDPNEHYEGVCIYLDGLSGHLHGNPETAERDRRIREQLRADFYEVIEITRTQLDDPEAMRRHFARLGRVLGGKERASQLKRDVSWYAEPQLDEPEREDQAWDEALDLLGESYEEIVNELMEAGVPPPSDVHWDLVIEDRVSGKKAIMVWEQEGRHVAVCQPDQAPDPAQDWIVVLDPETRATTIAELKKKLETTS